MTTSDSGVLGLLSIMHRSGGTIPVYRIVAPVADAAMTTPVQFERKNSLPMQRMVKYFSAFVRYIPTDNNIFRKFLIAGSQVFDEYNLDFTFFCPRLGIRWSAAGHPDLLTKHLLFEGHYQLDVLLWIRRLARKGTVMFDVGGHHGLMAIVAGKAVGPQGTVVVFEPHPVSRRFIQLHLELNGCRNVRVEPMGAMDIEQELEFYPQTAARNSWNSSFVREFVDKAHAVKPLMVQCTTIDSYVAHHNVVPSVIKVDTEGTEMRVLRGAAETIRKYRPSLILELNPRSTEAAGMSLGEFTSELTGLGYRFWAFPIRRYGGYGTRPVPYSEGMIGVDGSLVNVACIAE